MTAVVFAIVGGADVMGSDMAGLGLGSESGARTVTKDSWVMVLTETGNESTPSGMLAQQTPNERDHRRYVQQMRWRSGFPSIDSREQKAPAIATSTSIKQT